MRTFSGKKTCLKKPLEARAVGTRSISRYFNRRNIRISTNTPSQTPATRLTSVLKLRRGSGKIKLEVGARTGDNIASKLFTARLQDAVIKRIDWEGKGLNVNIDGEYLSHVIFADDVILFAKSPDELTSMLTDIHNTSKPADFNMNLGKTKVKFNEHAKKCTINVDGETIKKVDTYVYLGKTVTKDFDRIPEIRKRNTFGWAAFGKVDNIRRSRKESMKIKRKMHDECILPVMTHGCETWALNNAMMDKLAVAQRKMERIMLGIILRDRKRNNYIC